MDVLTLSLGGVDGWVEGAAGVVASRIVDKGKVITIAAGAIPWHHLDLRDLNNLYRQRRCLRRLVRVFPWYWSRCHLGRECREVSIIPL